LQLRLDPSRPSKDIDLAWIGDQLNHAIALDALRAALSVSGADFFSFELDVRASALEPEGSLTLPVTVRVGTKRFERFSIDIAPAKEGVQFDTFAHRQPPLGLDQIGDAAIDVLSVEQQLADKVCAIHEIRSAVPSSRWRDLADIAMMAQQLDDSIDAGLLHLAIKNEVTRRSATLPNGLAGQLMITDEQLQSWRTSWGTGGRHVPLGLDEALAFARAMCDPILAAEVIRGVWSSSAQIWKTHKSET